MPEKNDDNIIKLAEAIVEAWDYDTLLQLATERLMEDFEGMGQAEFDEEWNNFYEPESDAG